MDRMIDERMAIGLLEVEGVCAAFAAMDAAAKAGDIIIEAVERTRQGNDICIKMRGDVSSIHSAMDAAILVAQQVSRVVIHSIIPGPASDTEKVLVYSNI